MSQEQWIRRVTGAMIGAYRHLHHQLGTHSHFLDAADDEEIGKLIEWGTNFGRDPVPLKYLLRRRDVIPEDHLLMLRRWWSALTPESIRITFAHTSLPRCQKWKPHEDYTHFYLRCTGSPRLDTSLYITTTLRWIASGGYLPMDSNANIRASQRIVT